MKLGFGFGFSKQSGGGFPAPFVVVNNPRGTLFYDSFGNQFRARTNVPNGFNDAMREHFGFADGAERGLQDMSTDGLALLDSVDGTFNLIDDSSGSDPAGWVRNATYYTAVKNAMSTTPETSDYIVIVSGINDATVGSPITKAKYKQALAKLKEFVQEDFPNVQCAFLAPLPRSDYGSSVDSIFNTVREAQNEYVLEDTWFKRLPDTYDVDLRDTAHPSQEEYDTRYAQRFADAIAAVFGKRSLIGVYGPLVTSAAFYGSYMLLDVAQDGGTDFEAIPALAEKTLALRIGSTDYKPSSVSRVSATQLKAEFENIGLIDGTIASAVIGHGCMNELSQTKAEVIKDNSVSFQPLRVAEVQGRVIRDTYTASGSADRHAFEQPVYVPAGTTTLAVLMQGWTWKSFTNSYVANPNAFSVIKMWIECPNGNVVLVKWDGGRTKTINPGDNDIVSDEAMASEAGYSTFPAGTYKIKGELSCPVANDKFPYTENYDGLTSYYYASGSTTLTGVDAAGALGYTGSAPSTAIIAFKPILLGRHAATTKTFLGLGDSISDGVGDNSGTGGVYGFGFMQRAMGNSGTNAVPCLGLYSSGGRAAWLADASTDNRKWETLIKYANSAVLEVGTNDMDAFSAVVIQGYFDTIWSRLRDNGISKIAQVPLVARTDSTDNWATTANQSANANWGTAGGKRDTVNDYLTTKLGDGTINYVADVSTLLDTTDDWKWKVNGSANYMCVDDVHPSATGHDLLKTATRTMIDAIRATLVSDGKPLRSGVVTVTNNDPLWNIHDLNLDLNAKTAAKTYASGALVSSLTDRMNKTWAAIGTTRNPTYDATAFGNQGALTSGDDTTFMMSTSLFTKSNTGWGGIVFEVPASTANSKYLMTFGTSSAGSNLMAMYFTSGGVLTWIQNQAGGVTAINAADLRNTKNVLLWNFRSTSEVDFYLNNEAVNTFDPRDSLIAYDQISLFNRTSTETGGTTGFKIARCFHRNTAHNEGTDGSIASILAGLKALYGTV